MARTVEITESELLDAIAASTPGTGPESARTVAELAAANNLTPRAVRVALKAFAAQGRLNLHRVIRPALDGRRAVVSAYTVTV